MSESEEQLDREDAIKKLNNALRLQHRSIIEYTLVGASMAGFQYVGISPKLADFARAEVDATTIGDGPQIDYLYEPSPQEIFNQLLPRYVEIQVYRALLESNAAFFAAQMTAMDAATKNSAEMIGALTLYMNKVRQAAITREIIEVVSGAEAL